MPSQERIREVAYRIWREEGCPHGRDREHWEKARSLVAREEGAADATEPNPTAHPPNVGPQGEPVEPAAAKPRRARPKRGA